MDKKSLILLRIAVVVIIVSAIGLVITLKLSQNRTDMATTNTSITESVTESEAQAGSGADNEFPLKITSVNLEEIKCYGVPTVIDFGSDSCIPCQQMAPVLETLNAEFQGRAAIQFLDVWRYTDGVEDFPIQVIPTQVFFTADGKPFVPSNELAAQIPFDMYSSRDTGELIFTVHQGGITEEQMRMILAEMGVE